MKVTIEPIVKPVAKEVIVRMSEIEAIAFVKFLDQIGSNASIWMGLRDAAYDLKTPVKMALEKHHD